MAIEYTRQSLSFWTNNRHVMTTLENISSTVCNLQNDKRPKASEEFEEFEDEKINLT